jgi:plasmid stabilization system protein ParE
MRRAVTVRPEAQRDIEGAAFWYERQRPGLGDRFSHELDQMLERIRENPFQFPEVGQGVRRVLLHRFPYAVYFRTSEAMFAVVAVLHQYRHPSAWKGCI